MSKLYDIGGYFKILVFEISKVDSVYNLKSIHLSVDLKTCSLSFISLNLLYLYNLLCSHLFIPKCLMDK